MYLIENKYPNSIYQGFHDFLPPTNHKRTVNVKSLTYKVLQDADIRVPFNVSRPA